MPTPTYWLEPTDTVAVGLRCYTKDSTAWTCDGGYHEALLWTGQQPAEFEVEDGRRWLASADTPDSSRPNAPWPEQCGRGCGYRFTDEDPRQSWQELLYRRSDGEAYTLHPLQTPPGAHRAGPGASYDAQWFPDGWRGADGIALVVLCPRLDGEGGGFWDWPVDAPASSGGRWTRTGDPRQADVTASPSIAIGGSDHPGYYHGFLQAGVLTDHVG